MIWLFAVVGVAVLGGVGAVAAGRWGDMAPAGHDRPDVVLPAEGPLTASDLQDVRFSVAVRGYRMDEVDAVIRRLTSQLASEAAAAATTDQE